MGGKPGMCMFLYMETFFGLNVMSTCGAIRRKLFSRYFQVPKFIFDFFFTFDPALNDHYLYPGLFLLSSWGIRTWVESTLGDRGSFALLPAKGVVLKGGLCGLLHGEFLVAEAGNKNTDLKFQN